MRRKLAAGNWKMHGLEAGARAELSALARALPAGAQPPEVLICPPATLLAGLARDFAPRGIAFGGQDCHAAPRGAHTGDISAPMLADAGATHVILGHSERRQDHGETDAMVAAKLAAAWQAGLCAVLCIGETEAQFRQGRTLEVLTAQLAGALPAGATPGNLVLAYEPVWAIGTGLIPELPQIARVHAALRADLCARLGAGPGAAVRLLYGGSVKPGNAAGIFALPDVDGALVGGASLQAAEFAPILAALATA